MFDSSIVLVLVSQFFCATMYGLASPFLPTVFEEKDIATIWTGFIFAVYAIAMMGSSLVVGKILDKYSHRIIIVLGCLLMAISVACFGLIERLEAVYVIAISIVLRIGSGKFTSLKLSNTFIGIGSAHGMIATANFSYVAQAYPGKVVTLIALLEAMCGVGNMMGPVIGSAVYGFMGFSDTFYFFGACMIPITLAILFCLRSA